MWFEAELYEKKMLLTATWDTFSLREKTNFTKKILKRLCLLNLNLKRNEELQIRASSLNSYFLLSFFLCPFSVPIFTICLDCTLVSSLIKLDLSWQNMKTAKSRCRQGNWYSPSTHLWHRKRKWKGWPLGNIRLLQNHLQAFHCLKLTRTTQV